MNRLFHAVQLLFGRMHGSLYLATIFTATLFAAATGIVGASVTIIALMAAPVMMRSGYDERLCAGHDLRRRHARHPHPAQRDAGGDGARRCRSRSRGSTRARPAGPAARRPLPRLHDGARLAEADARAAAVGEGARRPGLHVLRELLFGLIPPAALIFATLGAIVTGWATPTEGAALGCVGALLVTAAHGSSPGRCSRTPSSARRRPRAW